MDDKWKDQLEDYAIIIAGWQLDKIERELRENSDAHPEFTYAAQQVEEMSEVMDGRQYEAWMAYAAALAVEMYLYGVRDGGRIHHAFTTGELPRKEDVN